MIRTNVQGSNLGFAGEATAAAAVVLVLFPGVFGGRAWVVAVVLVVALGTIAALARRGLPVAAAPLLAYFAIFAAAALHGSHVSGSSGARYLLRPLLAVAIAALPLGVLGRGRLLRVIVAAAAFEGLVAIVQAIVLAARYGRDATRHVDSVTGTLGPGQAAVLAFLCLLGSAIALGPWLLRKAPTALAVTAALLALGAGVATSTRAVLFVVPVVFVAAALALLVRGRTVNRRRLALVGAAAIAYAPISYGAITALYPGAFTGVLSSQNALVLGPVTPTKTTPKPVRHASKLPPPKPGPAAPAKVGVQLLPGRFDQLRTAFRISHEDGVGVLLLGRGYDTAELDPSIHDPDAVPLPERTGPTWFGRVLTECGWLGLIAFAGLLVWLVVQGVRLAADSEAIGAALPFVAALTAAGAVETTILDVRSYSIPFWIVVGLAAGVTPARSPVRFRVLLRSAGRKRVIANTH